MRYESLLTLDIRKKESPGSFLIEINDRLKEIIIELLERDIERSLWIDNEFERTWMLWRRIDLITDKNEAVLKEVKDNLTKL